ncbi:acyl-CoA desaturase [Jatrophihabitans sp.]|uniref:fatty acid desaturase family protein n=1 Tax=Jatrophihabitans sp. TaxID=1932789 RepID=UPI0030C6CB4C|nr:fatty acid desaturase [Jatrophihabitans sp.]
MSLSTDPVLALAQDGGGRSGRSGSDFAPLLRTVRDAHLLERRRGDYALRIGFAAVSYALTWTALVVIGDSWYCTVVAVAMGVAFTQVAFLGHDAGHQQIARTKRWNDVMGLVAADLAVGLGYGWWVEEHSRHHCRPNEEGYDPDIGDSVITFTDAQTAGRRGRVERFIAAHQAALFFPLLTLEGLNLHVQSIGWLRATRTHRLRRAELLLQTLHLVLYFGTVLLVLSPVKALVFVVIQQAVWGVYMGCSFAPNHKGMPTVRAADKLDFLRRQVITTRNIRGGRITDFALGGLNYQVEHHLFPNMPRANLRHAQPMVRAHCLAFGVPYTEVGVLASYRVALGHLHRVGAPLRRNR